MNAPIHLIWPTHLVKGEIDLALQRAEEALASTSRAPCHVAEVLPTHVHQVYGALSIVGRTA